MPGELHEYVFEIGGKPVRLGKINVWPDGWITATPAWKNAPEWLLDCWFASRAAAEAALEFCWRRST